MKIGFYSPYYDSLSGGERYVLTLAGHWSKTHTVSIFWNDPSIVSKAQERFHLDLQHVHVAANMFLDEPLLCKLFSSSQYDLIFFVSDGSVPFSCASKNILLFQAPFPRISYPFLKRMRYQAIVVYSEFTKQKIDPLVGKNAIVIYPPVDVNAFIPRKKGKLILSVGRFSSLYQAKKQHVLIDAFRIGWIKGFLKGWELVLAGGLLESDREYYHDFVQQANGLPIRFLPNCSFDELKDLYGRATIYWHAAGYEEKDPTKMEHFGITTVEAMASGCIPIVYNAGGQPEIVDHGKNGYLWNTKKECLKYTEDVIHSEKLRKELQSQAETTSQMFSSDNFCQRFDDLLHQITNKQC